MTIFIARHGETAFNAARIVQVPETPLNDRGMEQARRLGQRLASEAVSVILASDYARARMTAEQVQQATGAPLVFNESLRERHFGEHRGTPFSEIDIDIFAPGHHPPGGESWEQFHERVSRAWEQITAEAQRHDDDTVVVCHALVCHSLIEHHLALPPGTDDVPMRLPNTSLTIVSGSPPWQASRLGCVEHLDDELNDDPNALAS